MERKLEEPTTINENTKKAAVYQMTKKADPQPKKRREGKNAKAQKKLRHNTQKKERTNIISTRKCEGPLI